ncbi:ABC transporter permease [Paenibacillus campinasensis]|uniref:ABC transporter permease n=1 Tax=Paenibacillus campinasensis TaxID=66347 RepID=A0A268EDZ8_9BACL|nr:ABC transporter permease [Paenibacillus campinasensis]PAD71339.1 ABC transporter permease [Paenibacillus campinasensis]
MEETTSKGLTLFGSILLTIALITLVVILFSVSQAGAKTGQEKMVGIQQTLSQTEYTTYDNSTMTGSSVLNAVRQYMNQEQFGVRVITGKGGITTYGNQFDDNGEIIEKDKNTNIKVAQDQSNPNYINPSGQFKSQIVVDKNNVVRGIIFTQS